MELLQGDINCFKKGKYENPKFWSRFDGKPPLREKYVLDIACGLGSLCIDIALSGAKKVVGLDINSASINFAKEHLKQNHPLLANTIEFKLLDLKEFD